MKGHVPLLFESLNLERCGAGPLDDDERDVVARLGSAGEAVNVFEDRAADVRGRQRAEFPGEVLELILGIVLGPGVPSLGNSVGEENGQVAGPIPFISRSSSFMA